MQLEEGCKLVRLMVSHQVLDGEDGSEVRGKGKNDGWEGRHRRFTRDILGKIFGEGDGGELSEDDVGEGEHDERRCERRKGRFYKESTLRTAMISDGDQNSSALLQI